MNNFETTPQELAFALLEDATGEMSPEGELRVSDEINIDQFKQVLTKHEGLLENLTISLASWLVPKKKPPKKKSTLSIAEVKKRYNIVKGGCLYKSSNPDVTKSNYPC